MRDLLTVPLEADFVGRHFADDAVRGNRASAPSRLVTISTSPAISRSSSCRHTAAIASRGRLKIDARDAFRGSSQRPIGVRRFELVAKRPSDVKLRIASRVPSISSAHERRLTGTA